MHKEIQHILYQLYTRRSLRKLFLEDPMAFCSQQGISSSDLIQFIQGLDKEQIRFYADSLLAKRHSAVKDLLPLSAVIMGKIFKENFWEFAAEQTPKGHHKHLEDALNYAAFLRTQKETSSILQQALRFEQHLLRQQIHPSKWSFKCYRYPFPALRKEALAEGRIFSPKKGLCLFLWRRERLVFQFVMLGR